MSIDIGRKLVIVRAAFVALLLGFFVMTIFALQSASSTPSSKPASSGSDSGPTGLALSELPDLAVAPAIPSEEAVMEALSALGVVVDRITADGFGFGVANGTSVRFTLGGSDVMVVDSLTIPNRTECDSEGPSADDLVLAWQSLVDFEGPVSSMTSMIDPGVTVVAPDFAGVKFWEQSQIAGAIRYGSSTCYFQATIPFAGSLTLSEPRNLGSFETLRDSLSSDLEVSDFSYGYLPHPSGGLAPVWFVEVSEDGNTGWVSVPSWGEN